MLMISVSAVISLPSRHSRPNREMEGTERVYEVERWMFRARRQRRENNACLTRHDSFLTIGMIFTERMVQPGGHPMLVKLGYSPSDKTYTFPECSLFSQRTQLKEWKRYYLFFYFIHLFSAKHVGFLNIPHLTPSTPSSWISYFSALHLFKGTFPLFP